MMLLRSQSISYFNVKAAGLNPARGQFFAMIISCSRCSDSSMLLPFW